MAIKLTNYDKTPRYIGESGLDLENPAIATGAPIPSVVGDAYTASFNPFHDTPLKIGSTIFASAPLSGVNSRLTTAQLKNKLQSVKTAKKARDYLDRYQKNLQNLSQQERLLGQEFIREYLKRPESIVAKPLYPWINSKDFKDYRDEIRLIALRINVELENRHNLNIQREEILNRLNKIVKRPELAEGVLVVLKALFDSPANSYSQIPKLSLAESNHFVSCLEQIMLSPYSIGTTVSRALVLYPNVA